MSTDVQAVMDREARRRRMLHDPDLTGEVLLFALALDEVITTRTEQGRGTRKGWAADVEEIATGTRHPHSRWAKRTIEQDIPRFEPLRSGWSRPCAAPMIRREGTCGKSGTTPLLDHDPVTGVARWVYLCARHRGLQAQYEMRRREWIANGKPSPPPNRGGILPRYFDTDWTALYRWAAPHTEPLTGAREATPPRPRLRLIPGGADRATQAADTT